MLAANFVVDGSGDLRIGFGEREGHWVIFMMSSQLLAASS